MMTNKEHDDLWKGAFEKVPVISDSLRRQNAIAVLKELYAIGELSKENYTKALVSIVRSEGFDI